MIDELNQSRLAVNRFNIEFGDLQGFTYVGANRQRNDLGNPIHRGPLSNDDSRPPRNDQPQHADCGSTRISGRVFRTETLVDTKTETARGKVTSVVTYKERPKPNMLVPVDMREKYESRYSQVECFATYSKFRRFETEVKLDIGLIEAVDRGAALSRARLIRLIIRKIEQYFIDRVLGFSNRRQWT